MSKGIDSSRPLISAEQGATCFNNQGLQRSGKRKDTFFFFFPGVHRGQPCAAVTRTHMCTTHVGSVAAHTHAGVEVEIKQTSRHFLEKYSPRHETDAEAAEHVRPISLYYTSLHTHIYIKPMLHLRALSPEIHLADVISDFRALHFILQVINRHSILGFERAVYSGVL